MNNIFPTFEEIEKGYCVYDVDDGRGKIDEWGDWKPYRATKLQVIISHGAYNELLQHIYINLSRKGERKSFSFVMGGNKYGYSFPYNPAGWDACIVQIKKILGYYQKMISKMLNDINDNVMSNAVNASPNIFEKIITNPLTIF